MIHFRIGGELGCRSLIRRIFASVVSYVEAGHSRKGSRLYQGVAALVCHQFDDRFSRAGGYAHSARRLATQQALTRTGNFILRRVAEKDDISMPDGLHAASGVKADPPRCCAG